MNLKRPALLLGAALVLVVGCGASQPAASGPGTVVEATALITTSTAPPSTKASPTTTARGRSTTTRKGGPAPTLTADTARQQLRDTYGISFDVKQGQCLGDAFKAEPALLEVLGPDYKATTTEAQAVIDIFLKCLGSQRAAAHAIVENMQAGQQIATAQAACIEELLATVPKADLAPLTAGDAAIGAKYKTRLTACLGTTST